MSKPSKIWLVEQFEYDDSIMIGSNFLTEAYTDEAVATQRLNSLKEKEHPESGFSYMIHELPLDQERN